MLEASIEKYLIGVVKKYQGISLKLVPFGLKGIPDRLIVLPGPRIIFCELKRPEGGRYSPHQIEWRRRLTALGCEWAGVKTKAEVDALIGGTPNEQ
ncbi:hypothetical protein [Nostoc phage Nsp-JY18]